MCARFAILRLCLCVSVLTFPFAFGVAGNGAPKWVEVRSPHFTVVSDAGDKQARQVADQFEQIREAFLRAFPTLHADFGKPVIIYALKNEDSMKSLLPAYWEIKGHAHPAGIFISGEDEHCAVVRVNAQTANPYQVIYHEYGHALENLNFEELPLWLSEGIAEFLGNSRIHEGFVEVGAASSHHIGVLRENKLIPIDVLLDVDQQSPYYIEQDRSPLFYAESWEIVRYLLMDADAIQAHLLNNFLTIYQRTGNQNEAAKQAFGDLRKFADKVADYSRRSEFLVGRVDASVRGNPKSYSSRSLTPAEADALRGDLFTRTHRPKDAKAALESALQQDPKLALAHEGLGLLALSQHETENAEAEFAKAVQLNSSSFIAYYFNARIRMRDEMTGPDDTQEVIADLEKSVTLNPHFAPAYEALSSLYSLDPAAFDRAIVAGKKAIQLEPGTLSYALSYGYVLLRIGKVADAKRMAQKIQVASKTQEDQYAARQLLDVISQRERYDARIAANAREPQEPGTPRNSATNAHPPGSDAHLTYDPPFVNKHSGEDEYSVNGTILSAECRAGVPGKLALSVNTKTLNFVIPEVSELQVLQKTVDVSGHPPPCGEWKGRHAVLFFYKLKNKQFYGELSTLQFF